MSVVVATVAGDDVAAAVNDDGRAVTVWSATKTWTPCVR